MVDTMVVDTMADVMVDSMVVGGIQAHAWVPSGGRKHLRLRPRRAVCGTQLMGQLRGLLKDSLTFFVCLVKLDAYLPLLLRRVDRHLQVKHVIGNHSGHHHARSRTCNGVTKFVGHEQRMYETHVLDGIGRLEQFPIHAAAADERVEQ